MSLYQRLFLMGAEYIYVIPPSVALRATESIFCSGFAPFLLCKKIYG